MGTRQVGLPDVVESEKHPRRYRLLAPLRYLSIQNSEKYKYDIIVPVLVGLVGWVGYLLMEPKPELFGEGGLLRVARDMLIMSVPFLVGALAAVAMGPSGSLDRRPMGVELYLDGDLLTLRQFVCYLLGYLCFLALVTLIVVVAAELLKTPVTTWTEDKPTLKSFVSWSGTLGLSLLLSALSITVFWALYFLTDIVNRPRRD